MRWLAVTVLVMTAACAARAEDIVDVLRRSQQTRLDAMPPAPEGPRADAVRASFERLRRELPPDLVVELHVIAGATIAETLHGHIVVANQALGEMPESTRLFVLAHELGHVMHNDWLEMGLLYKRFVPGEVTPEATDPVAGPLGREASFVAHRQEFTADVFALKLLRQMGHPADEAYAAFMNLGVTQETATHPSTRKRVANLRAAEMRGLDDTAELRQAAFGH